MPLVIDCYNVLHADAKHALTTAGLCRKVAATQWRRHGVVVVCDGMPKPDERFDPPDGVEVRHSGPGRTADDVIVEMIEASLNPRRLVIVSSDHAIRLAARRRRANHWTSDGFLARLAEQLRTAAEPTSPEKPSDVRLTDAQVDDWLRAFGLDEECDDAGTA